MRIANALFFLLLLLFPFLFFLLQLINVRQCLHGTWLI